MAGQTAAKSTVISRLIIRRDRLRIPLWLIGFTLFTIIVPIAFSDLYGSGQERAGMVETMRNPAMTAMVGPGDLDNYTIGAMTAHNMILMTAAIVGLMSILLVTRHTRADEEEGRIEMIRSLPAGRLSNLTAVLSVLTLTNLILALVIGIGLYGLGIESMGLEGSLLYGAVLGGTGLVFAGITALSAQLAESSRGTIGLSVGVLLFAYLFRAVTDVSNQALSWLSPLGWVSKAEVYSANNWSPVILMAGVAVVLFLAAVYLHAIRDLERGFLPSRPGNKHASRFLSSPMGLALRLQRTGIISWAIGMYVLGASYGSILGDLEAFIADNEMIQQLLLQEEGFGLIEQVIPTLMVVMAMLATIPPVMAINKLYGEEKSDRTEHMLSRAVSRNRLMGSYLAIAILNGFVMISLAAIGMWSAGTAVLEEGLSFSMVYNAAIIYYPAMLVMVSLAACLIGFLPKLTSLIWLYVFYSFIVLYLGGLFQFPDWAGKISPFGHISKLPVEEVAWLPVSALLAVALLLAAIAVVGYNKRDISG